MPFQTVTERLAGHLYPAGMIAGTRTVLGMDTGALAPDRTPAVPLATIGLAVQRELAARPSLATDRDKAGVARQRQRPAAGQ